MLAELAFTVYSKSFFYLFHIHTVRFKTQTFRIHFFVNSLSQFLTKALKKYKPTGRNSHAFAPLKLPVVPFI